MFGRSKRVAKGPTLRACVSRCGRGTWWGRNDRRTPGQWQRWLFESRGPRRGGHLVGAPRWQAGEFCKTDRAVT